MSDQPRYDRQSQAPIDDGKLKLRITAGKFSWYVARDGVASPYERESRALDGQDVQSAISYSKSAWIKGKVAEWRDTKTVGLTLRITAGKVVWYIRRREATLRLAEASAIDLDTARYIAEQTRLAAKRKRDLREFVNTLVRLETTSAYGHSQGHAEIADQFADNLPLGVSQTDRRHRHHLDLDGSDPALP